MMLFGLIVTISFYVFAKWSYLRTRRTYLSPLITVPLCIITLLAITGISYDTYNGGAKWLSFMLQPATIAFAVPLYKYRSLTKKHALVIIVSVLCGSLTAVLSSTLIAEVFNVNTELIISLVPRSVTTPIAMDISKTIGGVPSITAVFVIITGLLGSLIGPLLIRFLKIESEIARGVLLGTGAHAMGTSKAFEFTAATGTISSLSMILAGILTLCSAPFLIPLFL
ncbi:MAG: CidB/LrgB family autolysis modulator [Firmicutes bacterium]|nr:CidB/LrgB family autolysis modulator [Bacillota bacterium]